MVLVAKEDIDMMDLIAICYYIAVVKSLRKRFALQDISQEKNYNEVCTRTLVLENMLTTLYNLLLPRVGIWHNHHGVSSFLLILLLISSTCVPWMLNCDKFMWKNIRRTLRAFNRPSRI
ncbi:hypothetical protein O6H91_03G022000 [Diphasiastrum complanatum]|uniref:Uncharacterized protein n=1 Tax=Diphasiastrum complanatum TaxID=34168 RepID=A0ACC2E475_DIPCM|nr:hypothetical protein O6H91_03G022000 [Diphasiastrum complanatum]